MKKIFFILTLFLCVTCWSQVKINTEAFEPSAILLVASKNLEGNPKGVLISPMSTIDIESIANPPKGLVVYDLDARCVKINIGTESNKNWKCLLAKKTL